LHVETKTTARILRMQRPVLHVPYYRLSSRTPFRATVPARVVARSILGGLHHEYGWEKLAA
jgi:hypothetical protein